MCHHAVELLWILVGKFGLMGANAALMFLLAERLALETYGLLVTVISAQLLLSRVLMLGVDTGMIRMRTIPELRRHAQAVVQAGLVVMGLTAATVALGVLVAAWLWPASATLRLPPWALAAVVGRLATQPGIVANAPASFAPGTLFGMAGRDKCGCGVQPVSGDFSSDRPGPAGSDWSLRSGLNIEPGIFCRL